MRLLMWRALSISPYLGLVVVKDGRGPLLFQRRALQGGQVHIVGGLGAH